LLKDYETKPNRIKMRQAANSISGQVMAGGAVETLEDAPNCAKKLGHRSTALRIFSSPRRCAPLGSAQAKAGFLRSLLGRPIAIGPLCLDTGQRPGINDRTLACGGGRGHYHGRQHGPRATSLVCVICSADHAQRYSPGIRRHLQGGPAFAAIYRTGASLLTLFFAGFLEPSRSPWSQLMSWSMSYRSASWR